MGVKRILGLMFNLLLIFIIVVPVWGQGEKDGVQRKPGHIWRVENGDLMISQSESVEEDLVFYGKRLEIDGVVKGDLIIVSGDIVINGTVEGSVLGLTQGKLSVNGRIGGNLRTLAQEIDINGNIEGSATVGAIQMSTSNNSRFGNGLLGLFFVLEMDGRVDGKAEISSISLARIGGRINGDLKVSGNMVDWVSPLEVTGKVIDSSIMSTPPSQKKGIKIGNHQYEKGDLTEQYQIVKVAMFALFIWLLGTTLLSLTFYRLFPRLTWSMSEPTMVNFRRSLLIGLSCLVAIPIAINLLFLSKVGIPIAILFLLIYFLLLIVFEIPVYLWVGRLLFKSKPNPVIMILMGALFQMIVFFTPLNFILIPLLLCLGIGMIVGQVRFQFRDRIIDTKI
jgi:cytoskeletal protein CcmA (bactofilin family)